MDARSEPPGSVGRVAAWAADVVIELDADRVIRWASPSVEQLWGWPPEQLVGRTGTWLVHPDDLSTREGMIATLAATGSAKGRLRIRCADGGFAWMEGWIRSRPDTGGILLAIRDVRAQVAAEQQVQALVDDLRAQGESMRATIASMLDPFMHLKGVHDERGRLVDAVYLDVNPAAAQYLRRPETEVVGRAITDFFSGAGVETVLGWCERAIASGQPLALDDERILSSVDGSPRWLDVRVVAVADTVSITWRDRTDEHSALEVLQVVADHAGALLLLDRAGSIVWVSPMLADTLGVEPQRLLGRPLATLAEPDGAPDAHLLAPPDAVEQVARLRFEDGERVVRLEALEPVATSAGDVVPVRVHEAGADVDAAARAYETAVHYRLLSDHTRDVVIATRGDAVVWTSPSITRLLGWPSTYWNGTSLNALVHSEDWRLVLSVRAGEQVPVRLKDRADIDVWFTAQWSSDARGTRAWTFSLLPLSPTAL